MNRRRVLAGVAATATGVLLAASIGGARAGEARAVKEGGTFRVVAAGLLYTIDPALAGTPPEVPVLRPACAGLLAFPDKSLPAGLRVEPDLAEAQPVVSKDGKTYTFRIRKDARFSDGTPVTARNFVRAFERIFDPSMNSSQVAYFDAIVGAQGRCSREDEDARGSLGGRPDPHSETHEARRGLSDPPGRSGLALCSSDGSPSESGGRESAVAEPGSVLRQRVRARRAGSARAQPVLSRTASAPRRPLHSRTSAPTRRPSSAGFSAAIRTMRSGRHSPSPRSRRTSGDATASTSRSSSSFPRRGCGRSCSTRAGPCSERTSSCGRPSTSRSTAER